MLDYLPLPRLRQASQILLLGKDKHYAHRVPWKVSSSAVSGVTRFKNWMYSSVWKAVIFSAVARPGLCMNIHGQCHSNLPT